MRAENFLRMQQQSLAVQGECDAAARADHQRVLHGRLESFHLLAQRRLRSADALGGTTHHAGFGDGGEVSQQIDVELSAHGHYATLLLASDP